jgi:cytochrome c oxidase subunit I
MAAITERLGGRVTAERRFTDSAVWEWLTTVDHKRIGILYLFTSMLFFLVGGIEAFLMRLQLATPDGHVVSQELFDQLFTMHGLTMIFLAIMPLSIGFINYIVPLQIGARDVAFPRLNALSYWLFLCGGLFLNSGWLLGGAPNAGWYNYSPINIGNHAIAGGAAVNLNPGTDSVGIDFYVLGLQLAGIGTLLSGVNFIVTILNMRAPGMTPMRLPLFVWTTLITSILIVFAFPAFTANLFLLMLDRLFGTGFFNVAQGGDVLLWQQLFWIFGHPEVYILIMPAFGIISEVIPTFSRKPLFGYNTMVFAIIAIAFLAFMVWSHHMFTVGMGALVNSVFAATSMVIAVPTGVKIFNWIATMYGGRLKLTTPMLFAVGFILCFVIGGMSGVMLAVPPADYQFNDSYFLVAHIHYVLIGGALFALFAGAHYWLPKITGRMLDENRGKWCFWLVFIGFNVTFFPMHLLGLWGMPRRVASYPANLDLAFWNAVCTFGVFILTAGILVFLQNLRASLKNGAPAGNDPWDARTLEWAIPSPAPEYNFAYTPLVRGRDPLWVEKMHGNGKILKYAAEEAAHGDAQGHGHGAHGNAIHIPNGTILPLIAALALTVAAYGTLYKVPLIIGLGIVGAFVAIFRLMYDHDPGHFVEPEGDA